MASKPAYRIPTLAEIREIPHNGSNVASTFAGCGGSSTGYRMAGYRVLAAIEFVPAAADSYEANMAEHTRMLRRDIRKVDASQLLKACGLGVGELDVLDGSPPCEPFSTAGRRDATWGKKNAYSGQHQRSDDLFFEYARLVRDVQPRVFVAENVTGLVRGRAKGQFKRVMVALRECGYDVSARILDASWLGVPQARQRVIIIGVRSDLGCAPVFPEPFAYQFTVRDAIGDLLVAGGEARMGSFDRKFDPPVITDQPAPTVVAGDSTYWHVDEIKLVQPALNRGFVHPGRTVDLERNPAPTVTAGGGFGGMSGYHLQSNKGRIRRRFTIQELRRICGFPDDYVLTGSFAQQWERLGDSVPPPMAAAWARTLADGPLAVRA